MSPLPASAALEIARKDLLLESRTRDLAAAMVIVCALVVLVFERAFDAGGQPVPLAAVLWITVVLLSTVGLARTFHSEADFGTLDLLVASPATPADLYLGKALSGAVIALFGGLLSLLFVWAFFGPAILAQPLPILLLLFLGAVGLAAQAALLSALSARARTRAALFPILMLPVVLPLLVWAVQGTESALLGKSLSDPSVALSIALVAAYDALFLPLNAFLSHWVLEA